MKYFLKFLTGILFISITGCKNERKFIYPMEEQLEIQRVCIFIKARGTNRFMILLGKIYPLNNDGFTHPLENVTTNLEDAGYFCGRIRLKNDTCSMIERKNYYKEGCRILR